MTPSPDASAELVCRRLSAREIDELVTVHREAFRGYANARLGDGYSRAFLGYFCRVSPASIAISAWASDRPVGYVCGLEPTAEVDLARVMMWRALRALALRPWLLAGPRVLSRLVVRMRQAVKSVHPVDVLGSEWRRPVMGLLSIAVRPGEQRNGVGRRLMREFEWECRERRVGTVQLSVYARNHAARGLYESAGWREVTRSSLDGGVCIYAKALVSE